jgi:hypothetical protein
MFTVWAPLALTVAAGFLLAYRYVGAPPPRTIRIATGAENGAYHAFAQRMPICSLLTGSRSR